MKTAPQEKPVQIAIRHTALPITFISLPSIQNLNFFQISVAKVSSIRNGSGSLKAGWQPALLWHFTAFLTVGAVGIRNRNRTLRSWFRNLRINADCCLQTFTDAGRCRRKEATVDHNPDPVCLPFVGSAVSWLPVIASTSRIQSNVATISAIM